MLLASELNRMMQEGVTIVVRNMQPGITVFTDDNTKTVTTWDANGDAFGGDIKEVPPTLLANPIFREHIMRGIYKIEEAPEALQAAMDGMQIKWKGQLAKRENAQAELEIAQERVIAVGATCIAVKGKDLCGSFAVIAGTNPSERPPLCAEHLPLAGQFVPHETGREVDGKPEVIWKRAQLARA